jgi:hypothetical protein
VLEKTDSAALSNRNAFHAPVLNIVMLMLSDTVGSVTDVAVTVTVFPVGTLAGAV